MVLMVMVKEPRLDRLDLLRLLGFYGNGGNAQQHGKYYKRDHLHFGSRPYRVGRDECPELGKEIADGVRFPFGKLSHYHTASHRKQ